MTNMREFDISSVSSYSRRKGKRVRDAETDLAKKKKRPVNLTHNDHDGAELYMPIRSYKAKTSASRSSYGCAEMPTSAEDRAKEVQDNLSQQLPNFSKLMLHSHVSGGFWLGLPKQFCDNHMPMIDKTIILINEDGERYYTKYLVNKNGLSGGWRGFAIAHNLVAGDVLVFQLIKPCKFKVYIIRAEGLTRADGAVSLLTLDAHPKHRVIDDKSGERSWNITGKEIQKYQDPMLMFSRNDESISDHEEPLENKHGNGADICSGGDHKKGLMLICYNESDEHSSSEVEEGITLSKSFVDFKDVKSFENFTIQVDGVVVDSEVPTHLRRKYFLLCCSQNRFLHDHLIKGLNPTLATGVISETIYIADAIREAKYSTTLLDQLESWDKTLKAFEDLGMDVGFLRARTLQLVNLCRESESVLKLKRGERVKAETEVRRLEERIYNARTLMKRLDTEIDSKSRELDSMFMEVARASW